MRSIVQRILDHMFDNPDDATVVEIATAVRANPKTVHARLVELANEGRILRGAKIGRCTTWCLKR